VVLVGVDTGAVPLAATGREVGDGANGRGPFVSGRERERGKWGRPGRAGSWLAGLARVGGREKEKVWAAAVGQEEDEEENESMRLFLFPISFSISYLYKHMFK
jgi:hypothetical protein